MVHLTAIILDIKNIVNPINKIYNDVVKENTGKYFKYEVSK